jgi:hypothetical protein
MEITNKKIINVIYLCSITLYISSCNSDYKKIGESYFIRKGDLQFLVDIGFGNNNSSEGLVDPTVFEVYWNEKYILAKTHPDFIDNRNLTEYYIIEKVIFGEKKARDYMIGPINKIEFEEKIKLLKLNIDNMEHILYDDLK